MGLAGPEILNLAPAALQSDYLLGLRGILAVQTFLTFFLQVFAPTAVKDSANPNGPLYQEVLRKTLSVLFWNESLIYSSIILLSARTIALPFLTTPNKAIAASSLFRRPFRLVIPVAIALGITTLLQNILNKNAYITTFIEATKNQSINTPTPVPTLLVYFNSLFTIFWQTRAFTQQNGSTAFPSQCLWIISVLFQQSYTIYTTMIIIPYTRPQWRFKAMILFVLTAWWVQSWAWYSITGLMIAEAIVLGNLRKKVRDGLPLFRGWKLPVWVPCVLCMFSGFLMQYLWVAWKPEDANKELEAHGGVYNSGRFNSGTDVTEPIPRIDNFLVVLGGFLLMECSQFVRWCLAGRSVVWLGKRSLSIFLASPIIIYSVGIKIFTALALNGSMQKDFAIFITLVACFAAVALAQELFYVAVEKPSLVIAKYCWDWIRR